MAVLGLLAFSVLSCGRDATGPNGTTLGRSRFASLRFDAQFPTIPGTADALSDIVPFTSVRVRLTELDGRDDAPRTIYDRTIPFPTGADSLELGATFPLPLSAPDSGILVTLHLAYINAQGDTVFRGGPTTVRARPIGSAGGDVPVGTTVVYTGTGANATSVELTPPTGVAVAGTSTTFTAVARDGQGSIIANTPIFFSSADTSRATVANPAVPSVTWRPRRGPATVIATLLNGPADTATFDISLPATQLLVVSGDAQSGVVGTALSQPLVLRVAASDSIGVAGVPVTFAVTAGGGTLAALVDTSDANGLVSTTWTVGVLGAQTVTATATGIAGATRTLTATATAGAATRLAVVTQPNNAVAGAPITTSVRAVDALGNLAATFNGAVDVVVDSGPIEGWSLGGTDTVLAVGGVASFTTLTLDNAAQYRFRFRAAGLDSAVSAPFTISPAPAFLLAPIGGVSQSGLVSTLLADSLEVRVEDAFGNGIAGATVNWSAAVGSGSVSPTASVTNAAGIAKTAWTLGATVGVQTVSVSSGAVGPIVINANGVPTVSGVRWTGAVSSNWDLPGNWLGGVVPNAADTVTIPTGVPFTPRLVTPAVVGRLIVEAGATLDLDTLVLVVGGTVDVDVAGAITAQPSGALAMVGSGVIRGSVPTLSVTGPSVFLNGDLTVTGSVSIGGGLLGIGTRRMNVSGNFVTTGTGTFSIDFDGVLDIDGDMVLAGGSTSGQLEEGLIRLAGDFTQGGGSPQAFATGPELRLQLDGLSEQTITMLNADVALDTLCATSCFGWLVTARPDGAAVTFATNAKVRSVFSMDGDSVLAAGRLLVAAGSPSNFRGAVFSGPAQLGALAYREGFSRSGTFAADSLIAWGNGTLILSENIRTVVRGTYTAASVHQADLVVDAGGVLNINGPTNIMGSFTSRGNGHLLMQQATDSLHIGGNATFDDDPPSGVLTAGVIAIVGNFAQIGSDRGFLSQGTHRVRMLGANSTISVAGPAVNRFNNLYLDGLSSVAFLTGATIDGSVELGGQIAAVSGTVTPVRIGSVLVDAIGGRWQVPNTIFGTFADGIPVAVQSNLTFLAGVQFSNRTVITGSVTVSGGTFDLNARTIVISGDFSTTLAGTLRMAGGDSLLIGGNATFNGASTLGLITGGHLGIGGNFQQLGDALSFSAVAPHETWFTGATTQTVSFEDPGYGAAASHFGTLYLGQTGSQITQLLTDVFVSGAMETGGLGTSLHTMTGANRLLRAQGADIDKLTLDNVRFRLDDGLPTLVIDTLDFINQDPTAVQFEIVRASGTVAIGQLTFATPPTTGRYLRVEDLDGVAGGVLTVNITTPAPSNNGGFLQVIPPAIVNGWTNATFRWTGSGGSSLWTNPANWSDGVVPGVSDSVYIPPATLFGPVIPDGTTLRALVSDRTETPVSMAGGMTITERLHVPRSTGISCGAGTVNVSGAATPVRMSGRVLCFTRMLSGTIDITDTLSIESNDLQVEGTAILQPGTSVVRVGNNFSTLGGGRLRMTSALGRLLVTRGATFAGGGSATDLQAGRVEVGGNFSQSGGFTYAAAPAHVTYLFDADSGLGVTKQLTFGEPVNSHFGTLEVDTWDRGTGTEIPVEGNFIGIGPVSMGGSGFLNVKGNVTVTSPLASIQFHTLRVGDTLTYAGDFGLDTVVFNGTTTQRPPQNIAYNFVRVTGSDVRMTADDASYSIAVGLEVSGGLLRVGAANAITTVVVGGDFRTVAGGRLQMINADASLQINGNALFAGGSTSGLLTDGVIEISGNFTQNTNPLAFVATLSQRTVFTGSGPATMQFANAGAAQSRFSQVDFARSPGQTLTLLTAARAENADLTSGNFTVAPTTGAFTVTGTYTHSAGTTTSLGLLSNFTVGACSGSGTLLGTLTSIITSPGCIFTIL